LVQGALVAGSGCLEAGLIVELEADQLLDSGASIDQISPWIEIANARFPAHARVWCSIVAMAALGKPFDWGSKGSAMRHAKYQLHEPEMKALYSN
jgi:hypothetical protein